MDFKFLVVTEVFTHRIRHVENHEFQKFGRPSQAMFFFSRLKCVESGFQIFGHKVFTTCRIKHAENRGFQNFGRPSQAPMFFSRLKCVESGFQIFGHQSFYLENKTLRKSWISKCWSPIAGADFFFGIEMSRKRISYFWSPKFLYTEQNVTKITNFKSLVAHRRHRFFFRD